MFLVCGSVDSLGVCAFVRGGRHFCCLLMFMVTFHAPITKMGSKKMESDSNPYMAGIQLDSFSFFQHFRFVGGGETTRYIGHHGSKWCHAGNWFPTGEKGEIGRETDRQTKKQRGRH